MCGFPSRPTPARLAQVDFGYVGMLYDPDTGVMRKSWVFVMVLGFSRKMYARIPVLTGRGPVGRGRQPLLLGVVASGVR